MTDIVHTLERALGDRYAIEGRLGAGATAVVLLARDRKHDRQTAIKVLRPEFAESLGTERFLREIRIVASFTHPHILPLYDSGNADGLLWYSMPLARGGSLRTRLVTEKRLPVPDAVRTALAVASALAYAHARGVVHRDIKPENILLEDGEVLLADFGLARSDHASGDPGVTEPGLAVGTPIYMSPEQAAGMPSDARADVYALACVLYEMLDGEPPFTGRTALAVLARHRTEAPRDLAAGRTDVPPALRAVVERGLAKLPADRYATAGEFADALRSATGLLVSGEDARVFSDPSLRPRPWWRRPEALATVGVSLALGLGLGILGEGRHAGARARPAEPPSSEALAIDPLDDPRQIAVLPMRTTSPDAFAGALAEGVTTGMVDQLSMAPQLSVASQEAVRAQVGDVRDPRQIGRRLQVGTVVDGSLAARGDSVVATVRLLETRSGRQLEAWQLVRPRGDLPQLSYELTATVTDRLRRRIGRTLAFGDRRRGTANVRAWELLQLGRSMRDIAGESQDINSPESRIAWARADSLFAQAREEDPAWPDPLLERAWLRARRASLVTGDFPLSAVDVDTLTTTAFALAAQAEAQGGDSAAVQMIRGLGYHARWVKSGKDDDLRRAEAGMLKATTLRPQYAYAWEHLSALYWTSGRSAEASVAARQALQADPWLDQASQLLARIFWSSVDAGRTPEALRACMDGRRRFSENPNFLDCRLALAARLEQGDSVVRLAWSEAARAEALDSLGRFAVVKPTRRLWVAAVLARSGLGDSAAAVAAAAVRDVPPPMRVHYLMWEAYVAHLRGDDAAALALLDRFVQARPDQRGFLAGNALFASLRPDPRFQQLVGRRS
jgi:serine/threonine-protein kinase